MSRRTIAICYYKLNKYDFTIINRVEVCMYSNTNKVQREILTCRRSNHQDLNSLNNANSPSDYILNPQKDDAADIILVTNFTGDTHLGTSWILGRIIKLL